MQSAPSPRRTIQRLSATCLFLMILAFSRQSSSALEVLLQWGTGSQIITDNLAGWDNNNTIGVIDFGPIILPDYFISKGTVDLNSGPNLTSIIGSPSASIRLTNLQVEAIGVPQFDLRIGMLENLTGTYTSLVGGDAIDAYVGHISGSAVPAGQDQLMSWQGYLDVLTFPPAFGPNPPIPNPALPASSLPLPYPLYGHGPSPLPGSYTNPILGADLYIQLGGPGDLFILNSSAEVGIGVVPEPSTWALAVVGAGALLCGKRRIARRR